MPPTVCYFGTYEASYDRNRILQDGLRANGVTIRTIHEPVLERLRHKTGALGSRAAALDLGRRLAAGWARLARRLLSAPRSDAVFVGYLGHLDVLLAAPLCKLRGEPLVFDAFVSLYDTLVHDRAMFADGSAPAEALRALDRLSCALADVVLLDTDAHVRYFADELGVHAEKCVRVLVGADPTQFFPPPSVAPADGTFTVLHYSKFAPLHGLRTILEAAAALEDDPTIRFLLVGGGQLEAEVDRWIDELGLRNVERRSWMEPAELRAAIATAGACLGIFGDTGKASRVIPNKVYQYMAVGAPIVTRDSAAARELLEHDRHALLVPPADSNALTHALRRLRDDDALGAEMAREARALFDARCTPAAIGAQLVRDLSTLPSAPFGRHRTR